jgi:hypothetical protein
VTLSWGSISKVLSQQLNISPHPPPTQYTNKLQGEFQSFKVDMKDLDLLSPAAHRDLEALQSSGMEKINYHDFLVQVSSEYLRYNSGLTMEQRGYMPGIVAHACNPSYSGGADRKISLRPAQAKS